MELKELYLNLEGNFDSVANRLMNEERVKKYVLRFTEAHDFQDLEENFLKEDYEKAFFHVHTITGVALNLNFDKLYNCSHELTEELRGGVKNVNNAKILFENLKIEYQRTISLINDFKVSNNL